MMRNEQTYDVVVIGSGLGGLVSALILAKEGKRVCVIEKNNQFGGNLQTFSRNKKIFDTGVHYLPSLDENQNLDRYFTYLGIRQDLNVQRMPEVYDVVIFDKDDIHYPHAQGKTNFVDQLVKHFPNERKALEQYVADLEEVCQSFPLYMLSKAPKDLSSISSISVQTYFDLLTDNQRLKAVLLGSNFLYAGESTTTPFYVHALTVYAYMQSAYKCIKGGSQLTKLLVGKIRELGGICINRQEVLHYRLENNKIKEVQTTDKSVFKATDFISNIDPKQLLNRIGAPYFRKVYHRRIMDMPVTTSCFSVHVVLKPKSVVYVGHNLFIHQGNDAVGRSMQYKPNEWLSQCMLSMVEDSAHPGFAESLTILTYMHFEEVDRWQKTANTIVNAQARGLEYERFKKEKIEVCLSKIEKYIPNLLDALASVYASTPLTYRDYIGGENGSMYGHSKDLTDPMHSFISPRTKVENLYLTGQGVNMHGVLGVTIGAVATCAELLGNEYLIDKIRSEVIK